MTALALAKLDEMRTLIDRAMLECDRSIVFWRNTEAAVSCIDCQHYAQAQLGEVLALRVQLQQTRDTIVSIKGLLLQ